MKTLFIAIIAAFLILTSSELAFAKRGCCSHHGGVAGCDVYTGKQVCNDGTLSKSCRCGE